MDKKQIVVLKQTLDKIEPVSEGQEPTSELTQVIEELMPKAELSQPDDDNITVLLLLGTALAKARRFKESCTFLENGISMITDPKQDRTKKEYATQLIDLGSQMSTQKQQKNEGMELIFKYRNVLIEQYDRNNKMNNYIQEIGTQLSELKKESQYAQMEKLYLSMFANDKLS